MGLVFRQEAAALTRVDQALDHIGGVPAASDRAGANTPSNANTPADNRLTGGTGSARAA